MRQDEILVMPTKQGMEWVKERKKERQKERQLLAYLSKKFSNHTDNAPDFYLYKHSS